MDEGALLSARLCLPALLLVLVGCQEPSGERAGSAAAAGRSAAELLEASLEQRAALTSLRAEAAMRILDPENDFTLRINTKILAQKPGRLRLRASKALGKVEVFDTVLIGNQIAFYVPRKRSLYEGTRADLAEADIHFDPGEILGHLLQPERALVLRAWRRRPAPEAGFFSGPPPVVLEERRPAGQPRLRVLLDPETLDLVRVEQRNADGAVVFAKEYGRYEALEATGPKRSGTNAPSVVHALGRYPFRMHLQWPESDRSVLVTFKRVVPEVSIPTAAWYLEVPSRTRTKPIREVRVEGDAESPDKADRPES